MDLHAVGIMAVLGVLDRQEVRRDALVERLPVRAAVDALEDAAAREAGVEVVRVARVQDERVGVGVVGRSLFAVAAPLGPQGVLVEALDAFPRISVVRGAEDAVGRGAGPPLARPGR
jgi:hypothetical protein